MQPALSRFVRGAVVRSPAVVASRLMCWRLPRHVVVEPTNHCNLRCPLCPHERHPRARGFMSVDQFRSLALECREFAHGLVLFLLGESLVHPQFFRLVAFAEELGLRCTVTTNGELLHRHIEDVFTSGLTSLRVTLDGATAETHARYRRGGHFERVRDSVERLLDERRRRGRGPHVAIQTIAFPFNAAERRELSDWARSVGADQLVLREPHIGVHRSLGEARELANEFVEPAARERAIAKAADAACDDGMGCGELWRATVLWNGDVVPCMRSAWDGLDSFGNVFRDGGLKSVWRSERHRTFLRQHAARPGGRCASAVS